MSTKFQIVHPRSRTKAELCHDFIDKVDKCITRTPPLPAAEMSHRASWLIGLRDFLVVELDRMKYEDAH